MRQAGPRRIAVTVIAVLVAVSALTAALWHTRGEPADRKASPAAEREYLRALRDPEASGDYFSQFSDKKLLSEGYRLCTSLRHGGEYGKFTPDLPGDDLPTGFAILDLASEAATLCPDQADRMH